MHSAAGVGAESVLAFVVNDFLDGGIAGHHFLLDFVVAEGEALEEGERVLEFLDEALGE